MKQTLPMSYAWSMANKETFKIKPIREFVQWHLAGADVSIDPFARNVDWATYTNDLNPKTSACYHLSAVKFLKLMKRLGIRADLIIFDPPYTIGQTKQCYESVGLKFTQHDAQQAQVWTEEKDLCAKLLLPGGIFLHFGYHSNGLGLKRGADKIEILLVAHGRNHNDTICVAERMR